MPKLWEMTNNRWILVSIHSDIDLQPPFYVGICSLTPEKFPESSSGLTCVSEWILLVLVWRKQTIPLWKVCNVMLKLIFVGFKFRLPWVQKRGKKQKMKNCILQKIIFYFSVFTSWKWFQELIPIKKIVWGMCARQKFFWTFRV